MEEAKIEEEKINSQKIDDKLDQDVDLSDKKEVLDFVMTQELLFLEQVFKRDSKNYHAWSHKIWLIERYELWAEQRHMDFVE